VLTNMQAGRLLKLQHPRVCLSQIAGSWQKVAWCRVPARQETGGAAGAYQQRRAAVRGQVWAHLPNTTN